MSSEERAQLESSKSAESRGEARQSTIDPDSNSPSDQNIDEIISTQTVSTSVFEFHRENGRTYHGYKAGTYHFPNDASEAERLEFQYLILHHAFSEKLHFAPLTTPSYILDIGTGTGTWAIEMGDTYPSATIEGTELSPIQPTAVPGNVHFIIDDAEQEDWVVPFNHYDYIHTRALLGCFKDFKAIIAHAFKHIKPGGYMESQEMHFTPYSDDGSMTVDWAFNDWCQRMHRASMDVGRPLRIANKLKRWYMESGFEDVQELVFKIPVGTWARDPHLKALGMWWRENILLGLQGFTLGYFTRVFSWSPDEVEVYLVDVRKSLADRNVHAYHKVYVVWGRKPEEPLDTKTSRPGR